MSRPALGNSKTRLLWEMNQVRRYGNKIREEKMMMMRNEVKEKEKGRRSSEAGGGGWWMPDPRTGIYYPKGCEWVMDDIPEGAANFQRTYWFRSSEGVELPTTATGINNPSSTDHPIIHDHLFIDA
ncbi:hypothetical protein DsansV1_C24g0182571 [Dioscorea sansibarensis]